MSSVHILVCIKQTFDTEETIRIENGAVKEEGVQWIINPYDEYAIEEAIQLRESYGGEVTVVTVGTANAESAIRHALAMGADQAVVIEGAVGDEYTISKALAAYAHDKNYDLILTGNQSVDNGAGQCGVRLAEELGIPHVTSIVDLKIENGKLLLDRDVEGDIYKIEASFPLLVTCQQGLNEPRYPSLPNIMKAKRKQIEFLNVTSLINSDEIQPKTVTSTRYLAGKRMACVRIEGEPAAAVKQLTKLLLEKVKVL